ncbi:MAG: hypothetical protein JXA14_08445 [Anaerolineae bacterium]|nr:hypothetical protein [Anaerolineae bacterium]
MRRIGSLLIIAIVGVAFLGGAIVAISRAQTQNCRFFDDSGHYVCDEFLEFYVERGGLEVFGYPLTEAYDDPRLGLRVQYFQRARMEWHSDNEIRYRLQLGLLVDELGYSYPQAGPEEIPAIPDPNRQYFPETGHVVAYAFLDYFRDKGGVDIFGYPRSELLYEDGYYVQYFQRARMEWHPEDAVGTQVRLTNIGEIYARLYDINIDPVIIELRQLNATASVRHVVVDQQGIQTVFVYVVDQYQNPVEGVDVDRVIRYQDGEPIEQSCSFGRTNAKGFAQCSFDFTGSQPGRKVLIDITARRDGLTDTAQTFFFLWW